jgi:hypothetical protein
LSSRSLIPTIRVPGERHKGAEDAARIEQSTSIKLPLVAQERPSLSAREHLREAMAQLLAEVCQLSLAVALAHRRLGFRPASPPTTPARSSASSVLDAVRALGL